MIASHSAPASSAAMEFFNSWYLANSKKTCKKRPREECDKEIALKSECRNISPKRPKSPKRLSPLKKKKV